MSAATETTWIPPVACAKCARPIRKLVGNFRVYPCEKCGGIWCEKCCDETPDYAAPRRSGGEG